MSHRGIGVANGTFGELLQGALLNEDENFLVTLPISYFSTAEIIFSEFYIESEVIPKHKIKSKYMVERLVDYYNVSCPWLLKIDSQLEEGKGLASSSADLVACARAVCNAFNKKLPLNVLLSIMKDIEPSDGVMHDEIVCFFHRKVALHSRIGFLPPLSILAIDESGFIDTIQYNQLSHTYSNNEKHQYSFLLKEISYAIKKQDLKTIGNIATQSAVLNQKFNPKKNLNFMIDLCNSTQGLGIGVAHSGTYIGIILDTQNMYFSKQCTIVENELQKIFGHVHIFYNITKPYTTQIISNNPPSKKQVLSLSTIMSQTDSF